MPHKGTIWEIGMKRIYNFSPGPATLPESVLRKAQAEFLDYGGTGLSVTEISHRSDTFRRIVENAEGNMREVMGIPDAYRVLFLQGGASLQFAMVPLNLFGRSRVADYVDTGRWSQKAILEARRYGKVNIVASSEEQDYRSIPVVRTDRLSPDAAYVHITMNNTIHGTRYSELPNTTAPLVTDMSSCILSERWDVSKFGLIYAGAQKNMGLAGLTVVIIRDDLTHYCLDTTPTMLRYSTHVESCSLFNTPPCFAVYFAGLMFEWIKDRGGISAMEDRNREKASRLYDFLDTSRLYAGIAAKHNRSMMNITFRLPSDDLTDRFVREAESQGLTALKGHRSIGGVRASLYNAMPLEGVQRLIEFMDFFEKTHSQS